MLQSLKSEVTFKCWCGFLWGCFVYSIQGNGLTDDILCTPLPTLTNVAPNEQSIVTGTIDDGTINTGKRTSWLY